MNADDILTELKGWVVNKEIRSPADWVERAMSLAIFLGHENDKLFTLQQECAKARVNLIAGGKTVAAARIIIEATDGFKVLQQQKAKITQCVELIRIAKIQSRLRDDDFKSQ